MGSRRWNWRTAEPSGVVPGRAPVEAAMARSGAIRRSRPISIGGFALSAIARPGRSGEPGFSPSAGKLPARSGQGGWRVPPTARCASSQSGRRPEPVITAHDEQATSPIASRRGIDEKPVERCAVCCASFWKGPFGAGVGPDVPAGRAPAGKRPLSDRKRVGSVPVGSRCAAVTHLVSSLVADVARREGSPGRDPGVWMSVRRRSQPQARRAGARLVLRA